MACFKHLFTLVIWQYLAQLWELCVVSSRYFEGFLTIFFRLIFLTLVCGFGGRMCMSARSAQKVLKKNLKSFLLILGSCLI